VQISRLLYEMGANVKLAVIPAPSPNSSMIQAEEVRTGDLFSVRGDFDVLISNSHAVDTAKRIGVPLYQTGFPVYKILGNTARVTIGYRGALRLINGIGNSIIKEAH
jgi:nitrogenase molybdenum-iron protein alpha/beta subunit